MTTLAAWSLVAKVHGYDVEPHHSDLYLAYGRDAGRVLWGFWASENDYCLYQSSHKDDPRGICNSPQHSTTSYTTLP